MRKRAEGLETTNSSPAISGESIISISSWPDGSADVSSGRVFSAHFCPKFSWRQGAFGWSPSGNPGSQSQPPPDLDLLRQISRKVCAFILFFVVVKCLTHTVTQLPATAIPMVSALWKASSDGDLDRLNELLNESSPADLEVKGAQPPRISPSSSHTAHITPIGPGLRQITLAIHPSSRR